MLLPIGDRELPAAHQSLRNVGKRWSAEEKKLLRRQIKAGVRLAALGVEKRTPAGIATNSAS